MPHGKEHDRGSLYGDHERFRQTYFSAYPGYYFTGDGCRRDEDGYYWITGRVDDVINVAGHRLGTAEVESALVAHDAVAEAAVVGYPHDIKGGFEMAEKYAKSVAKAVESIHDAIVKLDNVAHAPSNVELSSSMVVNFVLGASEKPVAMVYKFKQDIKSYIFSIRGSAECKIHLGRLVNEVASSLGGSGGGHDRACGAVIPKERLEEFIETMDRKSSG